MFNPRQIIYFREFYFKSGNTPKPKYFIILDKIDNKTIVASLPTRVNNAPGLMDKTHGCINIDDRCFNCYAFEAGRPICENGFAFPLPTFIYGNQVEDYEIEILEDIYRIEGVDFEVVGLLLEKEFTEFLKSENEEPLNFVGSVKLTAGIKTVAQKIRETILLPEDWASDMPNRDMVLKGLIKKIEATGVFVVMNGVIGNNTRRPLDRNEFQGFALSDPFAPFIFLNGQDYKAAKIFTLMHELAHIWLGTSAISDFDNLLPSSDKTEAFCNAVAAELLVLEMKLKEEATRLAGRHDMISRLATYFKVSTVVIARRLFDMELMNRQHFFSFYRSEQEKWNNAPKSKGGDFYASQPYNVGRSFFRTVESAAKSGKLLYTEAYRLMNLYGNTFHNFSNELQ